MEAWIALFLPMALLLMRVAGFFLVLPIFGSPAISVRVRVGAALSVTVFFGLILPAPANLGHVRSGSAILLMTRELLCGLGLGLAASLVFRSVQVGARFAERQMGFAIASVLDPSTGEQAAAISMLFERAFLMLFLVAGGHHLLLLAIGRSFEAFPIGAAPDASLLVRGLILSGTAMLNFAMRLAAPVIAAFVVLSVILGVLARVLPEMNVLLVSFPLRVGLGLFMAAALMPVMNDLTIELADWLSRFMVT